jgi:hypothetical protein
MPEFDFKENAPMLMLVLASVILMVTFGLPVGSERRRFQTRYQALSGFAGVFEVRPSSSAASAPMLVEPPRPATVASEPASPHGKARPRRRDRRVKPGPGLKDAPSHRWPHLVTAQIPSAIDTAVEKSRVTLSSGTITEKTASAAAPARSAPETADFVAESYENDPAKYPMDRGAVQGPIGLNLCGLSRQKNRYILKVTVTNRADEDFFVKELSVRDGRTSLTAKSFFRLFVEPGRAREGFVIFDAPHAGADVHVALKEDREKGRVVELSVPYSF